MESLAGRQGCPSRGGIRFRLRYSIRDSPNHRTDFVPVAAVTKRCVRHIQAYRIAADEALALIDDAFLAERLIDVPDEKKPVIINDRGAQMKAKPVKQMFIDLGLTQEFARPRTPNDNPFIESLFSTVKSAPEYPGWFPSDDITAAKDYFERYFHWYNTCHYHSRIGYVHPVDKH